MKEVLKIKRVVGCILKDEKVFVRILWEDKLVTWESPETLRCPLLFTNFLNKVDGLLQKKAFEEERIRRKVEEKSFISSIRSKESITGRKTAPRAAVLEHNRINRHIIKTAGQRTDELEKHKEFQHTYIANQKIVKEGNRSAKQQSESFGQKLNLGPYKSSFRASNKIFLNSQRYFEAPLSKQTGYIEKEEVDIQSKENDFVVLIDSVKIATFSYVCILGNLAMPFGKQFNVSHTIGFAEFENIMFSARQNVNFGDYDVYNLKLLNNNDKFRDLLLQGKENHVFVDISGEISFVLFLVFNSNKLKKYNICGYYNLVRIPAKAIRYAINPRLDKSLCDSYNLWQKNTYQYVDSVFRHYLISGPNLAEDKILKFSIFASSSNFLANEIRKFLTSRGKKYVSMDHTEIDTIFVHVEYLQFLNNMPFYFMLIESNCSFYFFGTSILKREGYFVAPMLKEGGVLLLADSIATQIDDQQLSQVMAFLRKDNMSKWQLVIGSSLAKKLESMLCQMPQNDTVRKVLFLSQNNVVWSSSFVPEEYIRNLRKKHLIEKRHFYILDPKINDNLHKTPKQFINIINNHK